MNSQTKQPDGSAADGDSLPKTGFVRLTTVLNLIPVSRSTWFAHRGSRFPLPVSLGPRIRAYRVEDIRRLLAEGVE
ncbi:AlpA family transcriptional regulator [Methylorubrum sp. B1-46]|uniref:helix-turn-helix transcriptional regulator n=1 Tax=Methylorubrum sp. B1-46 TaxID=2897334 RepID=UPI001E6120C0|nr:AlpA family transcriptional regulator [Methylorubrum sp. B1-46]UGB24916.1 AlpA family transcriptional regulator [Methylorubrum sp. B1-46]